MVQRGSPWRQTILVRHSWVVGNVNVILLLFLRLFCNCEYYGRVVPPYVCNSQRDIKIPSNVVRSDDTSTRKILRNEL